MLEIEPHPFSWLRAEVDAEAARLALRHGPVALLQAMVVAALARLLARLDHLIHLWRTGQLPALARPVAAPRKPSAGPPPATRRARRTAPRTRATADKAGQGAPAPLIVLARHPARHRPAAPLTDAPDPHARVPGFIAMRAPPRENFGHSPSPPSHALIVPI